ncbi:hypothetical protein V2O64_15415 [Verrucomicrobiaceae bacterium 227]
MKLPFISLISVAGLALSSCKSSTQEEEANAGRALVMESIAAHGGAKQWYDNGQLQFQWTYYQTDRGPDVVTDSIQTVDNKTLAVAHTVPGSTTTFGWNGGQAWVKDADGKFKAPPAFWALLPYYFVGIPFVFNDENASFEKLADQLAFEGKDYDQVKITFSADSGESPDDYYVLLIDPESKITRGAYYTVTHPAVVGPDGPGPAKFISLDGLEEFDGILLGTSNRTFYLKDGEIGEQMRHAEVKGIKFLPEGTVDLSVPADAEKL